MGDAYWHGPVVPLLVGHLVVVGVRVVSAGAAATPGAQLAPGSAVQSRLAS